MSKLDKSNRFAACLANLPSDMYVTCEEHVWRSEFDSSPEQFLEDRNLSDMEVAAPVLADPGNVVFIFGHRDHHNDF